MDKKILIPIIIVILVGGGVLVWHQFIRPAEEPPAQEPVNEQAEPPAVELPVFVPDETIAIELCRRAITRAQLIEIMGDETMRGVPLRDVVNGEKFVFIEDEEDDPVLGIIEFCGIFPPGSPENIDEAFLMIWMEGLPAVAIAFPPLDATFEAVVESAKLVLPPGVEIKEIEGIREKAVSVSTDEMGMETHKIIFLDPDVNQVMAIVGQNISYETSVELARQVERNLR
jgi:hypothetical protein